MISFGPYLTRRGTPESHQLISYTGYVVEFASEECSGSVSLFFLKDSGEGFEDLTFLEKDLICSPKLFAGALTDPHKGRPHRLSHLIAALYLNHNPATTLIEFLTDIREHIPLKTDYSKRRPDYKGLLKKEYEEAGFELIKLWQYGRTYIVSFGWVFPQDRTDPHSRLCLYVCAFECTPTPDRTLGKGRWLMPSDEIVGCLFARQFKKMSPKNPVDMLTDQGKQIALETFKWTKVSLLTPKELKKERIEFIRQHPDLCLNRLELAKAMIKAGLYSDTTQYSAIYKQLPGLIEASKEKEP